MYQRATPTDTNQSCLENVHDATQRPNLDVLNSSLAFLFLVQITFWDSMLQRPGHFSSKDLVEGLFLKAVGLSGMWLCASLVRGVFA